MGSMPLTDQERADFAAFASGRRHGEPGPAPIGGDGLMMLAASGAKIVGTAVTARSWHAIG